MRHRAEEERASDYDELVARAEAAKAAKRGMHGAQPPAGKRLADWTVPGADNAARSRSLLSSCKGKAIKAVCEAVYSGA